MLNLIKKITNVNGPDYKSFKELMKLAMKKSNKCPGSLKDSLK